MQHYFEDANTVLQAQETTTNGLEAAKAAERLNKYGRNKLAEGKKKPLILRFLDQMKDPMVIVLIAAAIISGIV
jgi:Ca2+-transporting ATPase